MKAVSIGIVLFVFVLAGFTGPDTPRTAGPIADVASWTVDASHSKVGFKVKHLGISTVRGDFRDYDVALSFDPADLTTLEANAAVQVGSIDTENERRDNHLRSDDFFSAAEHPEMIFESKGVRNVQGNTFELVGDLTIRGTTKEVVLTGTYLGSASMGGEERAAFEAETVINRMDYGLAWNKLTEAGGFVVGHDVTIVLELEVIKEQA